MAPILSRDRIVNLLATSPDPVLDRLGLLRQLGAIPSSRRSTGQAATSRSGGHLTPVNWPG
jgi:hypothetical protein